VKFPHLEELDKKFGRRGFIVITVNTMLESNADGVEFMTKEGITLRI
jgi:hypothetical protein